MKIEPKYTVNLNSEEVETLRAIVDNPKTSKTRRVKAELLLDLDGKSKPYTVIESLVSIYGLSKSSVYRLIKRYSEDGVEAVKKSPNPTPRRPHRMTPEIENKILSWIKTPPPRGRSKWSAYLIIVKIKEEGLAENISDQTIYRFLAKKNIKL